MLWANAVKIWNQHKKSVNAAHVYCLPRKGTPEHAHVKHIQAGGDPAKFKHGTSDKEHDELLAEMDALLEKGKVAPKKFAFKNKAKEARVAETAKKLKSEKVKAFLKAALERRRAKKDVGARVKKLPEDAEKNIREMVVGKEPSKKDLQKILDVGGGSMYYWLGDDKKRGKLMPSSKVIQYLIAKGLEIRSLLKDHKGDEFKLIKEKMGLEKANYERELLLPFYSFADVGGMYDDPESLMWDDFVRPLKRAGLKLGEELGMRSFYWSEPHYPHIVASDIDFADRLHDYEMMAEEAGEEFDEDDVVYHFTQLQISPTYFQGSDFVRDMPYLRSLAKGSA